MENRSAHAPEWGGGPAAFEGLTDVFYGKVVEDPLLGPVFAGMPPEHARYVASFIVEVFGASVVTASRAEAIRG